MEKLEKALELRKAKYLKRTGSPGNYKYIYREKTGRRRGIEKEIKKAYNWIFKETGNKFEAMVVLDIDGKVVASKLGQENSINIDDIFSSLKDKIFIHNHPSDSSFSDDDILVALTSGMKEMRAVSNKYEYIYRPKKSSRPDIDIVEHFLTHQQEALYNRWRPEVRSGKMTANEANMIHWHELATNFVKKFGGFYERRER